MQKINITRRLLLPAVFTIALPLLSVAQTSDEEGRYARAKTFEMVQYLLPVFVLLAILYAIVSIFRIKADNKIRQQLIEKGISEDMLRRLLLTGDERKRNETLKWAIVVGCTGAGMIISGYLGFNFLSFAVVMMSIAAGLIMHYFLAPKKP